jgi:hypothetical protein
MKAARRWYTKQSTGRERTRQREESGKDEGKGKGEYESAVRLNSSKYFEVNLR